MTTVTGLRHVILTVAAALGALAICMSQLFAEALAQNYTAVFHNPDPEYYVEGPGLVRLDDGGLLAVVPVVPRDAWTKERRVGHSVTHILRSEDGGKTWQRLSDLPYYSAAPWTHGGALYLFANKGGTTFRNDDLLLLRSGDNGKTWSQPVTLFKGHFWNSSCCSTEWTA